VSAICIGILLMLLAEIRQKGAAVIIWSAPAALGFLFKRRDAERDVGIGAYYGVTPAGIRAYLAARLGLPLLWTFISSRLVIGPFNLAAKDMAVIVIIAAALLGTLLGVTVCILLVVLASNRVDGLALSKLANFLVLGLCPLPTPVRFHAQLLAVIGHARRCDERW